MVVIKVRDRSGTLRELKVERGTLLMEALRDGDFGVEGTCGGACSCGTCHVYIAPDWAARLAPAGEDEKAMVEAIGELAPLREGSRLSCQIRLDAAQDGLDLEIAPPIE